MVAAPRILLFTKTTGYRHESIEAGAAAIVQLAAAAGVEVDHRDDGADFTPENLGRYAATVWLDVSGDVLEGSQREALAAFLAAGAGFAGVHCAADAEWSWPEYERILGARFLSHPGGALQLQEARMSVVDPEHPSTRELPDPWTWTDEWYVFTRNPWDHVDVVLEVDETSYDTEGVDMLPRHPISWHSRYGAGRTWYTALGHESAYFDDPRYRAHLWGGISSVLPTIAGSDDGGSVTGS